MNKSLRTSASKTGLQAPLPTGLPLTLNIAPALTPAVQELIQQHLHTLLGKGYAVVLLGSQTPGGTPRYHVQIAHEPTGLSIEHHDPIEAGFLEDLFILATQMKSMLAQRETLKRMGGSGKTRLLTWISDDISPALLKACEQAHRACQQAVRQMQGEG